MTAPDYVSPVVGHRVWQWDGTGLKSLNGVEWHPGERFTAKCRTQGCHEAPRFDCTCGVYASKSSNHLRRLGYTENRICGEVWLWGTIVEHEEGWRAQFAYPKNFIFPISMAPLSMNNFQLWLATLVGYGCPIFIGGETGTVLLWRRGFGIVPGGLNVLLRRCNGWYTRRAEQRRIKPGDRVAVLGHDFAIVEHADNDQVRAVLGNKSILTVERDRIVWDEQNGRWETRSGASIKIRSRGRLHEPW